MSDYPGKLAPQSLADFLRTRLIDDWMAVEHMTSAGIYHEQVPTGFRAAARRLASVYADHPDYQQGWAP